MMRKFLVLPLAFLLSGCLSPASYFHPSESGRQGENGAFEILDPANSIVVLYTPGSATNDTLSPCGAGGLPSVLHAMAGEQIRGKTILLHKYCSMAVGMLAGNVSMAEARAPDLEKVVASYLAQGVPAKQIIVSGHSMGGWAAVLVAAKRNVEIGGIIAFAPANGIWEKALRRAEHWRAVERQRATVKDLDRMNGLVYTFHGDPFNAPEDLSYMTKLNGLEYVAMKASEVGDGSCTGAHGFAFTPCFKQAEKERIRAFIEKAVNG